MDTHSLLSIAIAQQQAAPVLKSAYLPQGLAIQGLLEQDGQTHEVQWSAFSVETSGVIGISAFERILYQQHTALQNASSFTLTAVAGAGAEGQPDILAQDYALLAQYSTPKTRLITRCGVHNLAAYALCDAAACQLEQLFSPDVDVVLKVGQEEIRYPQLQLRPQPSVLDNGALSMALSDVQCLLHNGSLHKPLLASVSVFSNHDAMPVSAREWQKLRRECPPDTQIIWHHGEISQHLTLEDVLPSAYVSGNTTRSPLPRHSLWKNVTAAQLEMVLGIPTIQPVIDACNNVKMQAILSDDTTQAYRTAAVLFADGSIEAAPNMQYPPLRMPTCAERSVLSVSAGLNVSNPPVMLLLRIADDAGVPLLGEEAAPCGVCREIIQHQCPPGMLVVQMDDNGRFRAAMAGSLLPFSANTHQLPARPPLTLIPLAETAEVNTPWLLFQQYKPQRIDASAYAMALDSEKRQLLILDAPENIYHDCAYPPLLAVAARQYGLKYDAIYLPEADAYTMAGLPWASVRNETIPVYNAAGEARPYYIFTGQSPCHHTLVLPHQEVDR